ncbi:MULTISPECIES: SLC13 family permease [unclassified Streptomyces]|uniref:SLC13 family permease n=1 Tax=unclassified Streptomyces TaxID=2593676 RepID=UPI0004BE108E|nr:MULTISPECIES: SLC13 family permease [unclassified Streptomyces]KOV95535.1 DeoR faimly transcriptional regulator [Streptomyces sp. NRRL WC-3723]
MSEQLTSIVALVAIFLVGTLRSVNLGALALVASFLVGTGVAEMKTPEVLAGFPAELFVILVGVTYLFAIARNNGTVEWLVQAAVRMVGGKVAAIPWVMFTISCVLVSLGAVSPAAVAIIAPIGMTFAVRYGISPLLMGLMVVHGSAAGNFSPMGVLGVVTNGVVDTSGIAGNPTVLFLANLIFNVLLGVGIYFGLGGRQLLAAGRKGSRGTAGGEHTVAGPLHQAPSGPAAATALATEPTRTDEDALPLNRDRIVTLLSMVALVAGALMLDLDVGLMSLTAAVLLTLLAPATAKEAVGQINWSVVLLVCGIVTYVGLMQEIGTVDYLGDAISHVDAPLLAALLICYIGAIVSAFASTTGILGALIPLAVPLLATGQVSAIGLVAALSISASVVDSSPFSTNGAMVVANAPKEQQSMVYKQLMKWGFGLVLVAPIVSWASLTLLAG